MSVSPDKRRYFYRPSRELESFVTSYLQSNPEAYTSHIMAALRTDDRRHLLIDDAGQSMTSGAMNTVIDRARRTIARARPQLSLAPDPAEALAAVETTKRCMDLAAQIAAAVCKLVRDGNAPELEALIGCLKP